jgi:[DsrC]-trisulfide reductase subunit J
MYDGGKIITGLVIGVGLLLFPVFYNAGKAAKVPEPELTAKAKAAQECVQPKSFMRTEHMKLLDQWRDEVVRQNVWYYKGVGGKTYYMSLQQTCLDCHSNRDKFCDQCHNYLGVSPYCWDCHFEPKEKQ